MVNHLPETKSFDQKLIITDYFQKKNDVKMTTKRVRQENDENADDDDDDDVELPKKQKEQKTGPIWLKDGPQTQNNPINDEMEDFDSSESLLPRVITANIYLYTEHDDTPVYVGQTIR
ncbi:MAG: hypothetical protein CL916_10585, partial [Deltaproteobacteria bacterium]|nr:hypothetical protein [Deltaproteobacteria bacterium]